jgi:muramoyltetrapeptide carboxypeptidase LdcA involved in peptidoglycan recycling
VRWIQNLRQAGWFDSVNGILIGRSCGPDATDPNALSYVEALRWGLDGIHVPVIYDVDIGHSPPQMTVINGAHGELVFESGRGRLTQCLG